MKTIKLLLTLALILPSVSAALTFSLTPSAQNVNPGDDVYVDLNANNDQPFWAFSVKVDENPTSQITFVSGTPSSRLTGSLNGVTQNNADRITPYAVFGGNTQGITPANGQLFRLEYNVPANTPPGTYNLATSQLSASDQNGNPIQGTTISGATITVQAQQQQPPPPSGETGFYLPEKYGYLQETVDIPVCLTNTQTRSAANIDITITHDENIIQVTGVDINQGNGNSNIQPGNTRVTISGLNVQNADCEQGSGANIATIHYYTKKIGTSTLHFQTATADDGAQPFSIQSLENEDGQITVGNNEEEEVIKSCIASPSTIFQGDPVTVTYRVFNPSSPPDIGGVFEQDTFDDTNFDPSLPPTNQIAGSSLLHAYTPASGLITTVHTKVIQPFLAGSGTFNIYQITFLSSPSIPLGGYTFGIIDGPPPALEVSDDVHQDIPASADDCRVEVRERQAPPAGQGGGSPKMRYAAACCTSEEFELNGAKNTLTCCGDTAPQFTQVRNWCDNPFTAFKDGKLISQACDLSRVVQQPQVQRPAPTPELERPAEVVKAEQAKAEEKVPKMYLGEAARQPETAEGKIGPWIIGLLVLLLIGGAFATYTITRRRPEEPIMPPTEFAPPEIPVMPPAITPQAPSEIETPTQAAIPARPKIIYRPVTPKPQKPPRDNYEEIIRRKLAKLMKTKRAKRR